MNRQIRFVGLGIMVLFVVVFVQLNYLQIVHAPALQHNTLNTEQIVKDYDLSRGDIISSDGVTLADSTRAPAGSSFKYQRNYPAGSLFAQVTGYYSFIYGSDGVEKTYNSFLTGARHSSFQLPSNLSLSGIGKFLTNSPTAQNVTLTLSDRLQKVAQSELAGRDGSIVALDPSTGAILAMYSNPSYDPESLSQLSTVREQKAWKQLLAAPGNPLSPGAYRNRWFPGSTFKVITSAAVYDHEPALATKSYPVLSALPLPDTTNLLHNFGGETCGGQLPELFTVSCDTGFGAVGLDLGANKLEQEATAFGFNATPPIDLPDAAQSYFPPVSSFAANQPTVAYSAIGQEDDSATPLEMAMVAGAVADHGRIMTPHVLEKVTSAQNAVVSTYKPKLWRQATSPATASKLTTLMESVVNSPDGTGTAAAIPGVEVAGKTGTAQTGTTPPETDDWFIAFAPAAHPTIAVAVLLPGQGDSDEVQGGTLAAPLAKAMIEAGLQGQPTSSATSTTTTTTPKSPATNIPTSTTPGTSPVTASPTTSPTTTPPVTVPPTTVPVSSPPTTAKKAATTSRSSRAGRGAGT